jgi:hypothetical protein
MKKKKEERIAPAVDDDHALCIYNEIYPTIIDNYLS